MLTVAGFSFAGSGQNSGMAFIKLKDWKERNTPDRSANAIIGRAMGYLFSIKEAQVFAFNLPPIPELGTATGFDFFLQDRAGVGHDKLMAARNQLLGMAAQDPNLVRVRPNRMEDTPSSTSRSTTRRRWRRGSPSATSTARSPVPGALPM